MILTHLGAKSLTLRWTPGLSHIVHVNSRDSKILAELETAKPISASKSTRSFQLPVTLSWTKITFRTGAISVLGSTRLSYKSELKSRDASIDFDY